MAAERLQNYYLGEEIETGLLKYHQTVLKSEHGKVMSIFRNDKLILSPSLTQARQYLRAATGAKRATRDLQKSCKIPSWTLTSTIIMSFSSISVTTSPAPGRK